jgi:hypothetical protein
MQNIQSLAFANFEKTKFFPIYIKGKPMTHGVGLIMTLEAKSEQIW